MCQYGCPAAASSGPIIPSTLVDNTTLTPEVVAERAIAAFGLPQDGSRTGN